ncbi:MAG: hypothetical protein AB7F76_13415 [Parvibaculaceae bacterium]
MSDSELADVREAWETTARAWVPRLITQLDRDPTSSSYGCADRDWWHYKIRDFPSIILQQAGYTAWLAASMPAFADQADGLRRLAASSVRFWTDRARRWGAFEEYYPYEQGFPPLAFSTLAAIKLVAAGAISPGEVSRGMQIAARQLTTQFESEATNQQVAALAALAWMRRVYPGLVTAEELEQATQSTLASQTDEGWYREYGGPDLGYLSVALDCLWDAYDASGDERFLRSAIAALRFIDTMTGAFGGAPNGMLFARNTDYILPYGIARFCRYRGDVGDLAARLARVLYAKTHRPEHFLHAIDDRYVCHYSGHSLLRAINELTNQQSRSADLGAANVPASPGWSGSELHLAQSGHFFRIPDGAPSIAIALKKGGVIAMRAADGSPASDFGWYLPVRGGRAVSHWWSDHWQAERLENGWRIRGRLTLTREQVSRPWKHTALRMASWLFGRRLIGPLKRSMITGSRQAPWSLTRTILWEGQRVVVNDSIADLTPDLVPMPAPRASRRHVASADIYHSEDFNLVQGSWQVERRTRREGKCWMAETIYTCTGATSR